MKVPGLNQPGIPERDILPMVSVAVDWRQMTPSLELLPQSGDAPKIWGVLSEMI